MQPGMMLANPGINHDERRQPETVQANPTQAGTISSGTTSSCAAQKIPYSRSCEHNVIEHLLTHERPAAQHLLKGRENTLKGGADRLEKGSFHQAELFRSDHHKPREATPLGAVLSEAGLISSTASYANPICFKTDGVHSEDRHASISENSTSKPPAAPLNLPWDTTGALRVFQEALIDAIGPSRYEMLFAQKVSFELQSDLATHATGHASELILRIEDEFLRNWLKREYQSMLERLARECLQGSTVSFWENTSSRKDTFSAKTSVVSTAGRRQTSSIPLAHIASDHGEVAAGISLEDQVATPRSREFVTSDLKSLETISTIPSPDPRGEPRAVSRPGATLEQDLRNQIAIQASSVLPASYPPGVNLDFMRSESAHNSASQSLPLAGLAPVEGRLVTGDTLSTNTVGLTNTVSLTNTVAGNPLVSQMAGPRRGAYASSTTAHAAAAPGPGISRASNAPRSSQADAVSLPSAATQPNSRHGVGRATVAKMSRRPMELSDLVVGTGNELALAAARKVCDEVPAPFNPLYLFGNVGIGKTHLLEGISRQLRRQHPGLNVLMMTAEQFANCFTQALRDKTLPSFRQKFRNVDALLIDDVDFLDNTRVIREEFLHTFTELADRGRAIVLTADRHPKLLSKLGDELVTRFMSGLICRVEAPDQATRERIVQTKAARMGTDISEEALMWVAQKFRNNVRELEGALNCLHTWYTMSERRVGLATARQILADLERDCLKVVRLADIEQTICTLFGVRPRELKSSSRARTVSQPRMLAMFLARKHTQSAYQEIGQHFGGRNHSTVMAAEKKVVEWLDSNSELHLGGRDWNIRELMDTLEQQLLAS